MAGRPDIVSAFAIGADGADAVPYNEGVTEDLPDIEPETPEESGPGADWMFWDSQIKSALTHENRWRIEALECERLYFGPDNDPGRGGNQEESSKMNQVDDKTGLIHANVDVLGPLTYSETPQPVVRRRFHGDAKSNDETALMCAEVGQRLASYFLDTTDFDVPMIHARDDWNIAGRGAARILYKVDIAERHDVDPMTGQTVIVEEKVSEEVVPRAVDWRRLILAPAQSWDVMPWLAFEVPMTRKQVEDRFGVDVAERMAFDDVGLKDAQRGLSDEDEDRGISALTADSDTGTPSPSPFDTAPVCEIWSKETGEVIWWSRAYKGDVLDRVPDPLGLEKFYPMPRPLLATTKGQSLNPRPDIKFYAKRAEEVEIATKKLNSILHTLSVSGLFPGNMENEVKKILNGKNQMVPVVEWMQFLEKGGTNNLIQWLPIEAMIAAMNALITMREQAKAAMFEASGVSDVMRATSDPGETATAQQIKGRYAGLRISGRQRRMAEFARDVLRLMMEVGLEQFDTTTIADICEIDLPMTQAEREFMAMQQQMQLAAYEKEVQFYQAVLQAQQQGMPIGQMPPEPQKPEEIEVPKTSWEEIHNRLRTDFGRKVTLTIETQSTILADEQADKEARIEFLSAFATFVNELSPLVGTGQFDMKTVKELLLFGVRGFPKSRTLESLLASLPEEVEQQQEPEAPQITVKKIDAEVQRILKEMDMQNADKDREHDKEIKRMDIGGRMVERSADAAISAAEAPPPSVNDLQAQQGDPR
jgi:hypothetical protein